MARAKEQAELPWADLEPGAKPRRLMEWVPQAWPLAGASPNHWATSDCGFGSVM